MKQEDKNKSFFRSTIFKGTKIIFIIIALFFLSLAYFFYKDPNKLLLEYSHKDIALKSEEIHGGEKIQGSIKARENNLGIIAIPFEAYGRKNTDLFVFRLKEKNEQDWLYTREYESRLFGGYPHFPFGFPIISGSKGKTYSFELESLHGKPGNAVAIQKEKTFVISKYKFSREVLLENKSELISFFLQKSIQITQSFSFQRLFGILLFFSLAVFLLDNILSLHRKKSSLDASSSIFAGKKESNVMTGWFSDKTGIFFLQKNIITVLLIGSIIRILILKTSDLSGVIVWQFISPFSIDQLLISLQKQWQPLFFDIVSFLILYKLAQEYGKSGLIAGTIFFFHPLTVMLSGVHGVALNAGVFFSLLFSLHFFNKNINYKWDKIYIIVIFVILGCFVFPAYGMKGEMVGLKTIISTICSSCEELSFMSEVLYMITFVICSFVFFLALPVKNITRLFLVLILCFLSFTPVFLFGYIWLPIAFGSFFRTKWFYFFSVVSTLLFFAKNILAIFPFSPITFNYVWFSLFLWFCIEMVRLVPIFKKTSSVVLRKIDEFN